ncbi:MAG: ParB/Srx family N-terminal domain-containing protein [Planctomycetaceae bacterium]|nr:ParB/Srx family N-terminal domain-containing protein [Planctomycetaceae bacterium]
MRTERGAAVRRWLAALIVGGQVVAVSLLATACAATRPSVTTQMADAGCLPYAPDMRAGDHFMIDAERLHPTQPSLSFREVDWRTGILNGMSQEQVAANVRTNPPQVIIGPGGVAYLTDAHHTMRAILDSKHADKRVCGVIVQNWSDLSEDAFWARMQATHNVYLRDGQDQRITPAQLPASLRDSQSDPYRGLTWMVGSRGGFTARSDVFFQEFYWGEYFRKHIRWNDADDAEFEDAVQRALKLAHEPDASELPGYIPAPVPANTK